MGTALRLKMLTVVCTTMACGEPTRPSVVILGSDAGPVVQVLGGAVPLPSGTTLVELPPENTLRVTAACGDTPTSSDRSAVPGVVTTLEARKQYAPSRWDEAEETFDAPVTFRLPMSLEVVEGNAGNHVSRLSFRRGDREETCTYRGASSQAHPSGATQVALGSSYRFEACSDGSTAGATVVADAVKLVVNGDSWSPSRESAVTRVAVPLERPIAWVLPPALHAEGAGPGVQAELIHGASADAVSGRCTYGFVGEPDTLSFVGCSDGAAAEAVVDSSWASLTLDAACTDAGESVWVTARLLPPAPTQGELYLRLTPATVTLTSIGDARRVAVRAFDRDRREVSTVGLGLTLESFGPGITTTLHADGSVRVEAVALRSWGAFGVRATGHVASPTSGALVATTELREHVRELRASDVAHPAPSLVGIDPVPGTTAATEPGGVGLFPFESLMPRVDASSGLIEHVAVVRSVAAIELVPGSIFASTDGHPLQGIVLATESRGELTRVTYAPLTILHVHRAMDVEYRGDLGSRGYTLDALTEVAMRTRTRGRAGAADGELRVLSGGRNFFAEACESDVSSSLLELTMERGIKPILLGEEFVLRFDESSERYQDPRTEELLRLLGIAGGRTAAFTEALSFRLAEMSAWANVRFEYFAAIDARTRFEVAWETRCDLSQLGDWPKTPPVSLPFGLALVLDAKPELFSASSLTNPLNAPTATFRYSFSRAANVALGFQLGREVAGGIRPHPRQTDLDEDGEVRFVEVSSSGGNEPPFVAFDDGGAIPGTEPTYRIEATPIGFRWQQSVVLTLGPGVLLANALDRLVDQSRVPPTPEQLDLLVAGAERANRILEPLFREGIISLSFEMGAALQFGKDSSGNLLNNSFDNTTYICNELNYLAAQLSPLTLRASVLGGLGESLEALVMPRIGDGVGGLLFDISTDAFRLEVTPTLNFLSAYRCQNSGSATAHVHRDSRRCGLPLGAGESATLQVEAQSTDDLQTWFMFPGTDVPPRAAAVYLDGVLGGVTGNWRRLDDGEIARVSETDGVQTYRGAFELPPEVVARLSAGDDDAEIRLLSESRMLGGLPMFDQLTKLVPTCGCGADADCGGDRCVRESGEPVGTCVTADRVFTVFRANGLTFRPPGTGQAITGTSCGEPRARNVTLGATGDTEVLNDYDGRPIESAELRLDGEVIATATAAGNPTAFSRDFTRVELNAPSRDLTAGVHRLTLTLRGTVPTTEAPWEESQDAELPVRVEVRDCGGPPVDCDSLGVSCGSVEIPGGTLACGDGGGCACVGGHCADECVPATCEGRCGSVGDGCGGTLDCGSCGCIPTTPFCSEAQCGVVTDGCGGSIDCGACCEPRTACVPGECGPTSDGCGGVLDCGDCCALSAARTCATGTLFENPTTGETECRRSFRACMDVERVYDASRYSEPAERGYVCAASCGAFGYCADSVREVTLPGQWLDLPTLTQTADITNCCDGWGGSCAHITDENRDGIDDGSTFGMLRGRLAYDEETPSGVDELEYSSDLPGIYDSRSTCGACAWHNYFYTDTAAGGIRWCDEDEVSAPDPCPPGMVGCGDRCVMPGCCS